MNNQTGLELITAERARQIEVEQFTPEHDQQHADGQLAIAAEIYMQDDFERHYLTGSAVPKNWPFNSEWWKPTPNDRVRELVKAGALFTAENDRLGQPKYANEIVACSVTIDALLANKNTNNADSKTES